MNLTAGSSRYVSTYTDPSTSTTNMGGSHSNQSNKLVQVGGRSTSSDPENGGRVKKNSSQPKAPPLPMPPARLQALYSTSLLDVSNTTTKTDDSTAEVTERDKNESSNKVLDYLTNVRGLNISTLRKYGVGRAMYSFADNNNNWVSSECVTFPWIITVADAEYQESLRGSKFVWDQAETVQQQLDEQQQMYRESSYQQAKDGNPSESALLSNNTNMAVDSSCSIAADGDNDEQPMVATKDTSTSAIKAPPTLQEIKEQTFITRRIKVRSVERKDWQRMDPPGGGWGLFGYHTIPNLKPAAPATDDKKNKTM